MRSLLAILDLLNRPNLTRGPNLRKVVPMAICRFVSSWRRGAIGTTILFSILFVGTLAQAQEPVLAQAIPPSSNATEEDLPGSLQEEAETEETVGEKLVRALKEGDFNVDFRYRYEVVDQDDFDLNAYASTLRTVLNYRTASFRGFDLFLEAENVAVLGPDRYNNAGRDRNDNGVTDRPVVADPAGTEMNQAYLRYRGHDTSIGGGRQEINLRDQRYVGAVGWRQNHQSFDSIWLSNNSLQNTTIRYGFIGRANRVTGDEQRMTTNLLDGTIEVSGIGDISLYGYFLDFDNVNLHSLSTKTFGFELAGDRDLSSGPKVLYEIEFAAQRDFGNNPKRVDASYLHLMLGGGYEGFTAELGYEVLSGNPEDGRFTTPLATLHKFNGWADKFLNTPTSGLRDLYIGARGPAGPLNWAVIYHNFGADSGGAHYGTEIDFQATYTSSWKQGFGFKGAYYSADEFATNTFKSWLWTTYSF